MCLTPTDTNCVSESGRNSTTNMRSRWPPRLATLAPVWIRESCQVTGHGAPAQDGSPSQRAQRTRQCSFCFSSTFPTSDTAPKGGKRLCLGDSRTASTANVIPHATLLPSHRPEPGTCEHSRKEWMIQEMEASSYEKRAKLLKGIPPSQSPDTLRFTPVGRQTLPECHWRLTPLDSLHFSPRFSAFV